MVCNLLPQTLLNAILLISRYHLLIETATDHCGIQVVKPLLVREVRALDNKCLALLRHLIRRSLLTLLILKLPAVEVGLCHTCLLIHTKLADSCIEIGGCW